MGWSQPVLTAPVRPIQVSSSTLTVKALTPRSTARVELYSANIPDMRGKPMNERIHTPMPVAGYTTQTDTKIALVNQNKQLEEMVLRQLDALKLVPDVDQRWLQAGRTQLEQAFMSINRSVFKPGRAELTAESADALEKICGSIE